MNRFLIAASVVASTFGLATPAVAADVGVSISVGQPGFYGRIDIGDYPRPEVVYARPILIEGEYRDRPPIYMRVPPGHAKHWRKHCHEYNACGERVYFVRDNWYNQEYVPRYQERHRDERRDERGQDHRGDHGNNKHGDKHGHGHDD